MSDDTKRALEIIAPMAQELHIRVSADQRFLYCNGQAIGILANSTYATLMEFIGYLMFCWANDKGDLFSHDLIESIRRHWVSSEWVEQYRKWGEIP